MAEDLSKKAVNREGPSSQSVAQTVSTTSEYTQQRKKANQQKSELARRFSNIDFRRVIRLYLLPFVILLVFGAILFVLVIPRIFSIISSVQKINDINAEANTVTENISRLSQLNQQKQQISSDLEIISEVVPDGSTEIVSFQQKVTQLARSNYALQVGRGETSESSLVDEEEKEEIAVDSPLPMVEIPSTFALSGTLDNIKGFVNNINTIDDFVVVDEMSLEQEGGTWSMSITFVKYQFLGETAATDPEKLYNNVSLNTDPNQELLQFLRSKEPTE